VRSRKIGRGEIGKETGEITGRGSSRKTGKGLIGILGGRWKAVCGGDW
jgi:hypothetical protein